MINPDDNIEALQQQDFTQVQIERLLKLRRIIWEDQVRQATVEHRRLEFMRWLVQTRRLIEDSTC
jgi:hypothetical protein